MGRYKMCGGRSTNGLIEGIGMKQPIKLLCCGLLGTLPLAGCATHQGTGAAVGGLMGAGTGALIGKASGNAGAGALIGAGVGGLTGAAIGNAEDKRERREAVMAGATSRGPM